MDDFIQVLIFVASFVIFIVAAIRKQKKKQFSNTSSAEETLANIFGLNTNFEGEGVDMHRNSDIQHETKSQVTEKKEENNNIQKTDNKKQVSEYIDDIEEDDFSFDLRAAVIYSEILNKKTF